MAAYHAGRASGRISQSGVTFAHGMPGWLKEKVMSKIEKTVPIVSTCFRLL
jgi:hypothetical protein